MAYNANIPLPGDKLSNSQPEILQNFQGIGTAFALNHIGLDLANAGQHKLVNMPRQAFPQVVAGTNLLLYVGLDPNTALSELYLKRSTDPGDGLPFTSKGTDLASYGWSALPSGCYIKWGSFSVAGNVLSTVTMQGPAFTNINSYSVSVTINSTTTVASVAVNNLNTTQFQFLSNVAAVTTYRYLVIGV